MSVYRSILARVICETFERECGKWQRKKAEPKAFQFTFTTRINHETEEEGYRYLDVIIFGEANYVQVCVRSRWNVIPVDDLVYEDGECVGVKRGKSYLNGASQWIEVANHDSCWRDGIDRILRDYEKDIILLRSDGLDDKFWALVSPEGLPQ